MKKILFSIVSICMSFNIFASNEQHVDPSGLAKNLTTNVMIIII